MEDFDLRQFFSINAIQISDSYKNKTEAVTDFDEIKEILVLKKIQIKSSFVNRIYLHILLQNTQLYSYLDTYSKIKNLFWTCIGRFLGYRI